MSLVRDLQRTFRLDSNEVQYAIWYYLKNAHDQNVPSKVEELRIAFETGNVIASWNHTEEVK